MAAMAHSRIQNRMIALQEELDWEVYYLYSLIPEGASKEILFDHDQGIPTEVRPFLWEGDMAPPEIPNHWRAVYEKRRKLISANGNLSLIETPVFKRPWWGRQGVYGQSSRTYPEWTVDACQEWLLDRLESSLYWLAPNQNEPAFQSAAQLSDKASGDHSFSKLPPYTGAAPTST